MITQLRGKKTEYVFSAGKTKEYHISRRTAWLAVFISCALFWVVLFGVVTAFV